jgi:hypothetical protein
VRYAAADEQDRHGGSVILAPAVEMQNFREGDLVSVQGRILNEGRNSEHIPCPVYRASEVILIERSAGVSPLRSAAPRGLVIH